MATDWNDPREHLERRRVVGDMESAYHQLLCALSAADHLCVNNSMQSIVSYCASEKVLRAANVAASLNDFYAKVADHLRNQ